MSIHLFALWNSIDSPQNCDKESIAQHSLSQSTVCQSEWTVCRLTLFSLLRINRSLVRPLPLLTAWLSDIAARLARLSTDGFLQVSIALHDISFLVA
jgi:hypothetical protein